MKEYNVNFSSLIIENEPRVSFNPGSLVTTANSTSTDVNNVTTAPLTNSNVYADSSGTTMQDIIQYNAVQPNRPLYWKVQPHSQLYPAMTQENFEYYLKEKMDIGDEMKVIPPKMQVSPTQGGIVLGKDINGEVGIPFGSEGNVLLIGGPGTGKSSSIIMPTLSSWNGPFVAIDIKGELADRFTLSADNKRQVIILNPDDPNSLSVDPFELLELSGENNLLSDITDFATIIIPSNPEEKEPFWSDSERSALIAALLCYYKAGLSFSQAIIRILDKSLSDLCDELLLFDDIDVIHLITGFKEMKNETLSGIDRGLRNKLLMFANQSQLLRFFRGKREDAPPFSLTELENSVVFIQIPEDKVDRWKAGVTLLLTVIIKFMLMRHDKSSVNGKNVDPMLLAIDEFPRFERLPMISTALSTMRSKSVNLLLSIQSISQLAAKYGEYACSEIMDCCSYKAILGVTDPQSQRYIADMIGTVKKPSFGCNISYTNFGEQKGFSCQFSEQRTYIIQPEDLCCLQDVIITSPCGPFFVGKLPQAPYSDKSPKGKMFDSIYYDLINASEGAKKKVTAYLDGTPNAPCDDPNATAVLLGKKIQEYLPDYLLSDTDIKPLESIIWYLSTYTTEADELKNKAIELFTNIDKM